MAPECLLEQTYSFQSDVWSYGILIVEVFSRHTPYPGMEGIEVALQVSQRKLVHPLLDTIPPFWQEVMKSTCHQFKPEARMTTQQIVDTIQNHFKFLPILE